MEDFYNDGFNSGYGRDYLNRGHDSPMSDSDKYSYRSGYEHGERRRETSNELDREMYGEL